MTTQESIANTDEARRTAVRERKSTADGRFVYAVRTTGVYCRPSCPSRRAKRENVVFYEENREAVAAGFRACKRCRPDEISTSQKNAAAVAAACERLETAEVESALDDLARDAGLSRFHFHRLFKEIVGMTPKQ